MTSIYKASDFMPLVKVKKVIADVLEKGLIESVYHKNVLMQFLKEPDESPLPSNEYELNEDIQRDNDSLYTYFQIDFEDWGEEWDYTIVETLDEVGKYLELAEIHLDDPTRKTKVIVSGIAMTPPAFREWQKENLP